MPVYDQPRHTPFGWTAFLCGSVALVMVLVILWAGPFAPQQSAGVSLGELAAEIAKSAARAASGQEQPATLPVTRDVDHYLKIAVAVLSGLAVVTGLAAFVRRESKRAAAAGIVLGAAAIALYMFAWTVMAFAGALIIATLLYALRDMFGDTFDGLFGG